MIVSCLCAGLSVRRGRACINTLRQKLERSKPPPISIDGNVCACTPSQPAPRLQLTPKEPQSTNGLVLAMQDCLEQVSS